MQKFIIGVLLLVIAWLIFDEFLRPEPAEPPQVTQSRDSVKHLKALVASLEAAGDTLRHTLEAKDIEQGKQALKFKSQISKLTQKLAEKRPEIEPLLDSIPKLAAFVLLQDSIIDVQAVRIDSLEQQKARQWKDFNKLLDIEQEKFQAATEINLHLSAIGDHYREENKKLKRQNRWLKIGVCSAFVAGLLLSR